ncbi:MAG: hypothetical protein ACYDH8_14770 [Syntrophales bacterium]
MTTNKRPCVLCGIECDHQIEAKFEGKWLECPRCGLFGITRRLEIDIRSDAVARTKAAMLASERRIRKPKSPIVLSEGYSGVRDGEAWIKFDEFLSHFPRSAYEMLDRTLLNLAALVSHPSESIKVTESDALLFFSEDARGQFYMLRQMKDLGWITYPTTIPGDLTIEASGWQKIEELTKAVGKSADQAFVAMWFDDSMQEVYEKAIRPAVEKTGRVRCVRIDQLEHNNKICDQIVAEIRRSRYVIADFTGNRGGVYFEAGLSQGLGLPVIWIVKEDHLRDVHFDTRQYNHIVYTTPEDLYEKLANRIEATITDN